MDCLHPVFAYDLGLGPNGKHIIRFRPKYGSGQDPNLVLPCGKCSACRENKRASWIRRCNIELLTSLKSSFLTLTFDDAHCPDKCSKRDLQLFFKRFRNFKRDYLGVNEPLKLRYFAVGEYGKLKGRPHYHVIVFGVNFFDSVFKPYLVGSKNGYPLFSSKVLEHYWPYGFVTFDEVTPRNVRYVSKYVSKDFGGCCVFSQGLGRDLFVDFKRKGRLVIAQPKPLLRSCGFHDKFVDAIGKNPSPLPKFAVRYLERFYPNLYENLRVKRKAFYAARSDMTPPSLREVVLNEMLEREMDNRSYDKYS